MRFLWTDRRVFVAVLSIGCLTAMAFAKGIDTSMPIATIAMAIAAANAAQKTMEKKFTGESEKNGSTKS